jgi:hypothetical protein
VRRERHIKGPVLARRRELDLHDLEHVGPAGLVGRCKVAVVNADGSGYRDLTTYDDGPSYYPKWSAGGSQIAFVGKRKGAAKSVFIATPTGRPAGKLTPFAPYVVDW